MAADPTITVLIPAFNAQDTITAAIRSVCAQTRKSWEILVVDDGSRDGTVAVVENLQKTLPLGDRIVLCKLPHGGCASATHGGIIRARSDLITVLDADDEVYPTALEVILSRVKPATCYLWTRFRTGSTPTHAHRGWANFCPGGLSLADTFNTTGWWAGSHQRVFRRSVYLNDTPGLQQQWQQAVDLQTALLMAGTRRPTQSIDEVSYFWRKRHGQMSHQQREQQRACHRAMLHWFRVELYPRGAKS